MSEIHFVAVLTPAKGKSQRLREAVTELCKNVHEKEDYTLRYLATEHIEGPDSEDPAVIMIETYKDQESQTKHAKQDHFKKFFGALQKEGILGKAPWLAKTKSLAGFDVDRKLI